MKHLSPSKPASSEQNNEPSLRLLVVDDDDVDRERVSRLLAKIHFKNSVSEASSLQEARALLSEETFDCVFLDYHLGDQISTQLLSDIVKGAGNYLPVVMVTGNNDSRTTVEVMQQGAFDFIPKSELRIDLLETVLANSVRRGHLERALQAKQAHLQYLIFHDPLTNLPNRALFFDRLEQLLEAAPRRPKPFAVVQIDLDLFKQVNDTYGHAAGDAVLSVVAQRIKNELRIVDTVARLGGDEFAVLLPDLTNLENAERVCQKIYAAINEPILVDSHIISISASIGIALYPDHGNEGDMLLAKADRAMYAAKRSASMIAAYVDGMEGGQTGLLLEVSRLRQALEHDELFMEFQPIVDLSTLQVCGMEALVRWRTAEGQIIQPCNFVPMAERSSIIRPLTYSTIDMTLDHVQQWQLQGLVLPISINLSARMLDDKEMPEKVLYALSARGLSTSMLTMELTETVLMSSVDQARLALGILSSAGINISIDDFGAGFTSFKYLRQLDVAEIKIDMAFTGDLTAGSRDSVIVRSIASLANGFGIRSVAEGIENIQSIDALLMLGCDTGQGYAISRPMGADAVVAWVAQWNTNHKRQSH